MPKLPSLPVNAPPTASSPARRSRTMLASHASYPGAPTHAVSDTLLLDLLGPLDTDLALNSKLSPSRHNPAFTATDPLMSCTKAPLPHFANTTTADGQVAAAVSDPFCLPPGRDQRLRQPAASNARATAKEVRPVIQDQRQRQQVDVVPQLQQQAGHVARGGPQLPPATFPSLALLLSQLERHLPATDHDAAEILLSAQIIVNSAHRVTLLRTSGRNCLLAQNALGELDVLLEQAPRPQAMPNAGPRHLDAGSSTNRDPSVWNCSQATVIPPARTTGQATQTRESAPTRTPPLAASPISIFDPPAPALSTANVLFDRENAFEDDRSKMLVDPGDDETVTNGPIRATNGPMPAVDATAWDEIEFDNDDGDDSQQQQADPCPALAEIPLDDLLSTSFRTILTGATAKFTSQLAAATDAATTAAIAMFVESALTNFCAGQRPTSFDRKSFVEINQAFSQAHPPDLYSTAMAAMAKEMVDRVVRVMQHGPEKQLATLAYDLVRQRDEYVQGELSLAVYVECARRLPAVWNVIMAGEEKVESAKPVLQGEVWEVKDSVLLALFTLMSSAYRMQDIAKPLFLSPIAYWLQSVLINPAPATTLPPSVLQQALPLVLDLSGAVLFFHAPVFFSTVLDRASTLNLIPSETDASDYQLAQSLPWDNIAEHFASKPIVEWPIYIPTRSTWPTEYLKANGATLVSDTSVLKMHQEAVECVDPPAVSPMELAKELDILGLVNDCWVGMRESVAGVRRAVRETKESLTLARRWGRRASQDGGRGGEGGSMAEGTISAEKEGRGKSAAVMAMGLMFRSLHKRVFSQPGFFESPRFPFVVQALISLMAVDAYRSAFLRIVMQQNSSLMSAFTTCGVPGEPNHDPIWLKMWVSLCTTISWAGDNNHLFVTPLFCAIENAIPSSSTATQFASELVQHILGDAEAGAVMNQFDNDRYHALVDRLERHSQRQLFIRHIHVLPSFPSDPAVIRPATASPATAEPAPLFPSPSAASSSASAYFSFPSQAATPAPDATSARFRLGAAVADSAMAPAPIVASPPRTATIQPPVSASATGFADNGQREWWDMSPDLDPISAAYALPSAVSSAALSSIMDARPMFISPLPTPTTTAAAASSFNHQHVIDKFDAILLDASKGAISTSDATQRIQTTVNASFKDNTNHQTLSALLASLLTTGIKPECRMPASRIVRSCLVRAPEFAPMFWSRVESMSPVLGAGGAPLTSHVDIHALGKEADFLSFFAVLFMPESLAEANVEMPVDKLRAALNRILVSPHAATYAACLGAMIHAARTLFIPSLAAGGMSPQSPASLSMSGMSLLPLALQEQEALLVRIVSEYLPRVPVVHVEGWSGSDPKSKLEDMLRQVGVL